MDRRHFIKSVAAAAALATVPSGSSAGMAESKEGFASDGPRTRPTNDLLPLPVNRKTRISFRYFLPWAPAWGDPTYANQRLEELIAFGHASGIDSVQFFVNTFQPSYYVLPVDVESQKPWIDWMRDVVAPRIRKEGFGFELNFQEVLGASTAGTDMRAMYKWKQFMVDNDGNTSPGSPCFLDPIYREEMSKMLQGWASTKPDILWIDDDFRLHNHSTSGMYCYCPLHLKQFAGQAGRDFTREEILAQVLQPGPPSAFRQQWLDFLGGSMAEFAKWIAEQIHSPSPQTRVALMTSGTDIHSLEGRDWKQVLGNFAGTFKPLIRPTFGLYTGTTAPPKSASASLTSILAQMQVVEQSLGENNCDFAPELENTRYTTWAKSVAHSTFALLLGQLAGAPMITTAINDLDGSAIAEEPTTVPLLRNARPRMEAIAALNLKSWPVSGLVVLADKDIARKTHLKNKADYSEMAPSSKLVSVLCQMGIPLRYSTAAQAAGDGQVVLLEAAHVWLANDDELKQILSGSVLMTSSAARLVGERGFADWVGVTVGKHRTQTIQSEEYVSDQLPGVSQIRVPHRGADWDELEIDPHAEIASWFCDMLGKKHVGTVLYSNYHGGKIVVYAQNSDMQGGLFGSHARLRWLHGVLLWLTGGRFPALPIVPQHGLSLLKQSSGKKLYSFCNLGTDVLSRLTIRWPNADAIKSILSLQRDGSWQAVNFTVATAAGGCPSNLVFDTSLNCYEWIVLQVE